MRTCWSFADVATYGVGPLAQHEFDEIAPLLSSTAPRVAAAPAYLSPNQAASLPSPILLKYKARGSVLSGSCWPNG
jgi:hypothetical protein